MCAPFIIKEDTRSKIPLITSKQEIFRWIFAPNVSYITSYLCIILTIIQKLSWQHSVPIFSFQLFTVPLSLDGCGLSVINNHIQTIHLDIYRTHKSKVYPVEITFPSFHCTISPSLVLRCSCILLVLVVLCLEVATS